MKPTFLFSSLLTIFALFKCTMYVAVCAGENLPNQMYFWKKYDTKLISKEQKLINKRAMRKLIFAKSV